MYPFVRFTQSRNVSRRVGSTVLSSRCTLCGINLFYNCQDSHTILYLLELRVTSGEVITIIGSLSCNYDSVTSLKILKLANREIYSSLVFY